MLFTYLIYYILKNIYILLSSLITIISFASTPFLFFYFFPPTHLAIINVSHLIEKRKRSVRLWRKTCVLRHPIDSCHVDNPLKSLSKTENKEQNNPSENEERTQTKAHRHSPPSSIFACPTSTTPHTGAHRHRVRRSYA